MQHQIVSSIWVAARIDPSSSIATSTVTRKAVCRLRLTLFLFVLFGLGLCGESRTVSAGHPRLPVVFVPGTGGSQLQLRDGRTFWLNESILTSDVLLAGLVRPQDGVQCTGVLQTVEPGDISRIRARLKADWGTTTTATGLPIYQPFCDWATATLGASHFQVAAYDWRLGAGPAAADSIDRAIDRVLRSSGSQKCVLVAHSLGGLVAQDYLQRLGSQKVAHLITAGTPWLGTPKSGLALLAGYDLGLGVDIASERTQRFNGLHIWVRADQGTVRRYPTPTHLSFLDPEQTRQLARSLPCVFQMLPRSELPPAIIALSADQLTAQYKQSNPELHTAATQWRDELLARPTGVPHTLIAACNATDFQVVQYALPNQVVLKPTNPALQLVSGNSAAVLQQTNDITASRLREQAINRFREASRLPIYIAPGIPTAGSYESGDSTVPFQSATAGLLKKPRRNILQAQLGGDPAEVFTIDLERRSSHQDLLSLPAVQAIVQQIVQPAP